MQDLAEDGYLLDTNMVSAATYEPNSRHEQVRAWLARREGALIFISTVTIGEIRYGESLARAQPDRARATISDPALADFTVLDIDAHTARLWGAYRATIFDKYAPRDRRGRVRTRSLAGLVDRTTDTDLGIQENDLWIVSAAVAHGLVFVTTDKAGGMRRVVDAANYEERTIFL